jgi:hypothetical protein
MKLFAASTSKTCVGEVSHFARICNVTKPYKLKDGKIYHCRERLAGKTTVMVGTVFENSKVPLKFFFAAKILNY